MCPASIDIIPVDAGPRVSVNHTIWIGNGNYVPAYLTQNLVVAIEQSQSFYYKFANVRWWCLWSMLAGQNYYIFSTFTSLSPQLPKHYHRISKLCPSYFNWLELATDAFHLLSQITQPAKWIWETQSHK